MCVGKYSWSKQPKVLWVQADTLRAIAETNRPNWLFGRDRTSDIYARVGTYVRSCLHELLEVFSQRTVVARQAYGNANGIQPSSGERGVGVIAHVITFCGLASYTIEGIGCDVV